MEQLMIEPIFVEAMPEVPGLVFRPFRGPADYPGIVMVVEGSREADKAEWVVTVEELTFQFDHLENCDPFTDMVMVEVEGQLVGYGRCWWYEQLDNTRLYTFYARLHAAWRGLGIRRAMLHWMENRLRQITVTHPQENSKFLQAWSSTDEVPWCHLLESEGYQVVRYGLEMGRPNLEDIPDCPIPEGVVIRPGTLEEWRQIWEAAREAFRDHWGASEWPESRLTAEQESPTFYPPLWRIAWAGDEVAGGVLNFIDRPQNEAHGRERGYTETIFVRRPWRGQGLAKALIAHSFVALKDAGMTEAALGLDADNPNGALHLYRKMGFQETKRFMTYRKPMTGEQSTVKSD